MRMPHAYYFQQPNDSEGGKFSTYGFMEKAATWKSTNNQVIEAEHRQIRHNRYLQGNIRENHHKEKK
jgi:hypothetical protein